MNTKLPSLYKIALAGATPGGSFRGCLSTEQRDFQESLLREFEAPLVSSRAVCMPWYAEQRTNGALSATGDNTTAGDQGGDTIATAVPEIGMAFRDALVLERLGARVLAGLRANVNLPSTTPGLTLSWASENAASGASNEAFQQLALAPLRVTAYMDVSVELLRDDGPSLEGFLRADLMNAAAVAVQQAVIFGTGSGGQPLGILNTTGIGSVVGGTNGAAPTNQNLSDLEYAVTGTAKADRGSVGWLVSPYVRRKLRNTPIFAGGSVPIWGKEDAYSLLGRPAGVTPSVPDNLTKGTSAGVCSAIICGEFSELFLGLWGPGPLIEAVSSISQATTGQVRLIATVYFNSGVRIPSAFAAMTDALAA